MPSEIMSYLRWKKAEIQESLETELVQEKESELEISDADSDVLFEGERRSLSRPEYQEQKALYRMAVRTFGADAVPDIFCFGTPGSFTGKLIPYLRRY